jgi:mevalonate kinase
MSDLINKKYFSKLLLFGEYTIIDKGAALVMPLNRYFGHWAHTDDTLSLNAYLDYLMQFDFLNEKKIEQFKLQKLAFKSSIPVGYGLGSSGAITAACYDLFSKHTKEGVFVLQSKLAMMESYFHGKSSGLDPLCILLNKAIVSMDEKLNVLEKFSYPEKLFLLDSKQPRNTKSLVKVFFEKKKSPKFSDVLVRLDSLNRQCINGIQSNNLDLFKMAFKEISQLQLDHFSEMIPEKIRPIWREGLVSDQFCLKLGGAGGGGIFIGMGDCDALQNTAYIS